MSTTVKVKFIVSSPLLALSLGSGAADIDAGISAMDMSPSLAGQKTGY